MINKEKVKNPNARIKYLKVLKQFKKGFDWDLWFKKYDKIIIYE
jgi:hypothetical protein